MLRNNYNENQGPPLESIHNRCELKERIIEVVKQSSICKGESTLVGPGFVKLCRENIMTSNHLEETSKDYF